MVYKCEPCNYECDQKGGYEKHIETEKHKKTVELFKLIEEQKRTIEECKTALQKQKENYECQLQKQKESYECQLDNKDKAQMKRIIAEANLITKCAILERTNETLARIAEKPVNITHNNTNYKTINNILNILSPEAIDYTQVNNIITAEVASRGADAIATAVHDKLLTDGNGKPKVVCTDPSRNKFKLKNELTGELMDDQNLENVKTNIRHQIDFNTMKRDAIRVAEMEATNNETAEVLAREYMSHMRLDGKAGKKLSCKVRRHYVSTAKVKFIDR